MATQVRPNVDGDLAALLKRLSGRSFEIERQCRLPSDIASAMFDGSLLRLLVPRTLGGLDGDWRRAFEAVESVASIDGSTGWLLMIGTIGNMLTGIVDRDIAGIMAAGDRGLYLSGVFEPKGVARLSGDEACYRLSGRWRFATGVHLSNWCCVGALSVRGAKQEVRQFFLPTQDYAIHSNWDVFGLSGTGSDDIELKSAVVAPPSTFTFDDEPWADGWLWRVPYFTVASSLMAGAILGMARGALDIVFARGAGHHTAIGFKANRNLDVEVATVEAAIRSCRAFVIECIEEVSDRAQRGLQVDDRLRATAWLAALNTAQQCGAAMDLLVSGEGASAIRRSSPVQIKWRDVRAAAQHVLLSRQRLRHIGEVLLGSPPNAKPFL